PEDRHRGTTSGVSEQQWEEHYGRAHRPGGARYLDGEHAPHLPGHVLDVHRSSGGCRGHGGARSITGCYHRAVASRPPGRGHGGGSEGAAAWRRLGSGERHHAAHGAPHHGGCYISPAACDGRQTLVQDGGPMNLTHKLIQSHLVSGTLEAGEEIALRIDQTL